MSTQNHNYVKNYSEIYFFELLYSDVSFCTVCEEEHGLVGGVSKETGLPSVLHYPSMKFLPNHCDPHKLRELEEERVKKQRLIELSKIKFTKVRHITCLNCGVSKYTKDTRVKYCSQECLTNYHNKAKYKSYECICKICDLVFISNKKTTRCTDHKDNNRNFSPVSKCKVCDSEYLRRTKANLYCSNSCWKIANPGEKKVCLTCGEPKNGLSVCLNCKVEKVKPTLTKVCQVCSSEFVTTYPKKINCSRDCYRKSPKQRNKNRHLASYKLSKALRKRTKRKAKLKYESWTDIENFIKGRPEGYHLDHIIPLNHPDVCGLHNTCNFQWLTPKENSIKSNKFDGTYENNSWRKG